MSEQWGGDVQGHGLRRAVALGAAALLTGIGLAVGAPPTPPASALLTPPASIVIDGNTAGPNDWDDLPPNLLDSDTTADACGSGVLDPTQLDGKLDALDVNNPNPTPGNVVNKGDFCRVWRAVEAVPDAAGNLDIVLYGAWQRFFPNGEVTGYWPLLGPDATSKDDDYLIAFEYESSGPGSVEVLDWNGSTWVSLGTLPDTVFEFALDDPSRPLFGEFALNLSAARLWQQPGVDQCTAYSSDYVFSRTGNSQNAELQDYVGLAPYPISPCGELVVRKETLPDVPEPPVEFGYALSRGSTTIAEGDLVVPTAPSYTISPIPGGTDYTLSEATPPAGWTLQSIECTVLDPRTGEEQTISSGTSPLDSITVTPGYTTECVITNVGPPTLTIIKQTIPEGGTDFPFNASVTGVADLPFSLSDGDSQSIPVTVGDTAIVSELIADPSFPAGWSLQSIQCVGNTGWVAPGPGASSTTVVVRPGEQIVCVFVNVQEVVPLPTQAYLVVRKVAPGTDGTTPFDFTVAGDGTPAPAPAAFPLTPPSKRFQVVTVTPAPAPALGTPYTVTETVTSGWLLTGRACLTSTGGTGTLVDPTGITVTLAPGQIAVCTFTNEPVPPPLARLTVEKNTVPADPNTVFPFILRGPQRLPGVFTLTDGGSTSFDDLEPGTYTVTEDVPLGWAATGSCDDGTILDDGRVTVDLESGDDVTCTFTNTKRVSLTLTKIAQPQSPQVFAFPVALNRIAPVEVLLDDDGDPTDDPDNGQLPNTITGSDLPPGIYTISETPVAGWTLTSLSCTGAPADTTRPPVVLIDLDPGESAACTYTNTKVVTPSPSPTPTPSATPTPTPSPSVTSKPKPTLQPTEEASVEPTDDASEKGSTDELSDSGPGDGIDASLLGAAALIASGMLLLIASRRRT